MKNNMRFAWLLLIPVAIVVIYLMSGKEKKDIDWTEHYLNTSKDPYGTYVVFELLKNYNKQKLEQINKPLNEVKFENKDKGNSSYVFIGEQLYLTPKDLDSLLKFAEEGNIVFISGNNFPYNLMDTLFKSKACSDWTGHYSKQSKSVVLNFQHFDLKDSVGFKLQTPEKKLPIDVQYDWRGINGNYFCDTAQFTTDIGNLTTDPIENNETGENFVNFISYNYGKGKFLLHTTPVAFTNYHILKPDGKKYADIVFSHLNSGHIYWDEFNNFQRNESNQPSKTPLKLILSNRSLKTAWYLTIGLMVVYIIFFAKRKQRIIPILEQNINSSLEYVKTVGNLYFMQNQHRKLMRLKMRYFLSFVRQRYHLNTNNLDENLMVRISQKSNIPISEIEKIFGTFNKLNRYDIQVNVDELISLHETLDTFYKHCK